MRLNANLSVNTLFCVAPQLSVAPRHLNVSILENYVVTSMFSSGAVSVPSSSSVPLSNISADKQERLVRDHLERKIESVLQQVSQVAAVRVCSRVR